MSFILALYNINILNLAFYTNLFILQPSFQELNIAHHQL